VSEPLVAAHKVESQNARCTAHERLVVDSESDFELGVRWAKARKFWMTQPRRQM
jgi:hypothetical protein